MLGHGLDNLLGIGAAVLPRLPHFDPVFFKSQIGLLKCLGLKVLHVDVSVSVLDEERVFVDLGDAGKVSEDLLVGELGIILLGGNKLVVMVEDVVGIRVDLSALDEAFDSKVGERGVVVELVLDTRFRTRGD